MLIRSLIYGLLGWCLEIVWTALPKGRPADCVLVSYELPGEEPVLFALSSSVELRWHLARHLARPNDNLWAGWKVAFPRAAVPLGATLAFWAVDAEEPRLYRIEEKKP